MRGGAELTVGSQRHANEQKQICKHFDGLVVLRRRTSDQQVAYSTPGRALSGYYLDGLTGKPSRYVTNHLDQLSLPSFRGRVNRVPACLPGVTADCVHLRQVAGNTV